MTSLSWVDQWLSVDVEFRSTELVDPNHNGQLALDDPIVDLLCWSFHVVLDPSEDVGFGGIAKEDDGLFITLSGLAELIHHTIKVFLVGSEGTEAILSDLALAIEVPQSIPVFVDIFDILTVELRRRRLAVGHCVELLLDVTKFLIMPSLHLVSVVLRLGTVAECHTS